MGPRDQGTKGPKDQGTKGPMVQGTTGPREQGTKGPRDQWSNGPTYIRHRKSDWRNSCDAMKRRRKIIERHKCSRSQEVALPDWIYISSSSLYWAPVGANRLSHNWENGQRGRFFSKRKPGSGPGPGSEQGKLLAKVVTVHTITKLFLILSKAYDVR